MLPLLFPAATTATRAQELLVCLFCHEIPSIWQTYTNKHRKVHKHARWHNPCAERCESQWTIEVVVKNGLPHCFSFEHQAPCSPSRCSSSSCRPSHSRASWLQPWWPSRTEMFTLRQFQCTSPRQLLTTPLANSLHQLHASSPLWCQHKIVCSTQFTTRGQW